MRHSSELDLQLTLYHGNYVIINLTFSPSIAIVLVRVRIQKKYLVIISVFNSPSIW